MHKQLTEADKVRAAYRSAQANVHQEFSPDIVAASKKRSNERMERLANGLTTPEEEEAMLMKQWNNLKR
ncbi:TPA: hypothetical protein MW242_002629 [Acinetobacter baumannii]|nr:hypothetical protein [Acinetobacter baumannii]